MSLAPGQSLKPLTFLQIPYWDKLVHVAVYGLLAILLMHGFARSTTTGTAAMTIYSIVLCLIIGIAMEVLQGEMRVGRYFEVFDIIANIIGALIGSALFVFILKERFYGSYGR